MRTEKSKRSGTRCKMQKSVAWQFHDVPLNEFC
jgi:hypothetical protein